MILQMVGFFVVFGGGLSILLWVSKEVYNYFKYQLALPFDSDDLVNFGVIVVLICIGVAMIFYASHNAPFTTSLNFNLKIQ